MKPYLVKIPGRKFWHIRDGKRRISTGCEDQSDAILAVAEYVKNDLQAKPKGRTVDRVDDLIAAWEDERKARNPETHKAKWRYVAGTIRRHIGHLHVAAVTSETAREYATDRRAEGVGDATIRQELQALRSAWKIAQKSGALADDAPEMELPKASEASDVFLTKEEAGRLLDACDKDHLYLFVRLGLSTGGRHKALLGLTWSRVDLESGLVDLRRDGPSRAEKRRSRVPVDQDVIQDLERARSKAVTRHVIEYRGAPLSSIRKAFAAAVSRSGIDKDVTPHVLRHSSATWMAQAGVPFFEIAGFLGHSDTTMVERVYGHHHPDYMSRSKAALALNTTRRPE